MNQTVLSGNLTADIETLELGENHLSKFTVACNQGEHTTFLPVQAWNQEHLQEFLGKGSKVLVSGSLRQENWETKQGDKRSRIVLNAYQVEFLDPPAEKKEPTRKSGSKRDARRRRAALISRRSLLTTVSDRGALSRSISRSITESASVAGPE